MQDVIVIGAGIVGLATARQLKINYPDKKIMILEKENFPGMHQTGHNSGVIHSGIYYKPGSLKAINCTKGYLMMLKYCKEKGIFFELCGKIIVATDESEFPQLVEIKRRGEANGLVGLTFLESAQIKEREPNINGVRGILVPQTGIVDYLRVSESYLKDFRDLGGSSHFNTKVNSLRKTKVGYIIETNNPTESCFDAKYVINCAGLNSDRIAMQTNPELDLRIIPFRGEYYYLREEKKKLINNLVYPVPNPAFPFLGVHFTRTIDGIYEAGPNAVLSFKREGYQRNSFNFLDTWQIVTWPGFHIVAKKYWKTGWGEMKRSLSKKQFTLALQKLMPCIQTEDLVAGLAGVRAQACDLKGNLLDDFAIYYNEGIAHVCNAPSPAATSSLAIAEHICKNVAKYVN